MYSISRVLEKQPKISESRMVASGLCLWLVWEGKVSHIFNQSLRDHGGIFMAQDSNQALWFFFHNEAYRALARIQTWARLNPIKVFIQVMPGSLLVGYDLKTQASVAQDLRSQQISLPNEFQVWVHPSLIESASQEAGISFKDDKPMPGMAKGAWQLLTADPSFSYEPSQRWYFVVKPLGRPLDKDYTLGWRSFFKAAEPSLERMRLKYIYNEQSLILSVESLAIFQELCKTVLGIIDKIKADDELTYWPCVMAAVPAGGLHFNQELPNRMKVDFSKLTPDYPHLSYRTAFMLSGDFVIHDISYFISTGTIDDWCYVSMNEGEGAEAANVPFRFVLPLRMLSGDKQPCFYCGLKNHVPADCPSKSLPKMRPGLWKQIARLNIEDIGKLALALDDELKGDTVGKLEKLLHADKKGLFAKVVFENSASFQLRMFDLVCRSRSKDFAKIYEEISEDEFPLVFQAIEQIRSSGYDAARTALEQAKAKQPRNYQPRGVEGYLALEQGDFSQAQFYWREADRLAFTGVQHAVLLMLQGRVYEVLGEVDEAVRLYRQSERQSPDWVDPLYRQGVCMIKMGFTEQAMYHLRLAMEMSPHVFNRILVDPEIERGRHQMLSELAGPWQEAANAAAASKEQVESLHERLESWFTEDNEFARETKERLKKLIELAKVHNYVAHVRLTQGAEAIASEFDKQVDREVRVVDRKITFMYDQLKKIQKEASWFPFPKLLREFSKDFNFCAEKLNWMKSQNLQVPENFKKSQTWMPDIRERLETLRKRLVTLRIIRDATLFVLLMGRNFIWLELIGLGLALITVPLAVYLARTFEVVWLQEFFKDQQWQIQKGLVITLSVLSLAIAAIRTTFGFEKRKEEIFQREYKKTLEERVAQKRQAMLKKQQKIKKRNAAIRARQQAREAKEAAKAK
jgi:tetratricopeptide (TPR) repeat protein